LNRWKNVFSELLNVVHRVSDVRQKEIHIAGPLVPDPSPFEVKIATPELKRHISPDGDRIPAALTQAGGETLLSGIHKVVNSTWNKEELPDQWKESIIVPIYKKGDKTDCNNYRGISLLFIQNCINILPSSLSIHVDEIIGDHRCGYRRNRSTIYQIYCINQILEKKWEHNETVHPLFIDFKKAYDTLRREVLYITLIDFLFCP
jgi:hypothetical protein